MARQTLSLRDLFRGSGFDIPTGDPFTIEVHGAEARLLEMEDINFHFDSCVFLPDPKCADDEVPAIPAPANTDDAGTAPESAPQEQERITGLAVLRACYLHAQENAAEKVVIAGHTDTSSKDETPAYNLKLSQLRAENVLHLVLGERDAWVASSNSKFQVEDYQDVLRWVAVTFGWDCHPGEVDNVLGPATERALRGFQTRYNKATRKDEILEGKAPIAVDGAMGPETWGAFFDLYMFELAELMGTEVDQLGQFRSSIQFVDDGHRAVGCGAFHPIEKVAQASQEAPAKPGAKLGEDPGALETGFRSSTDRRVEILFFAPGDEPKFPCHPAKGQCKPAACEIYNGHFTLEHIACEAKTKPRLFSRFGLDLLERAVDTIEENEMLAWMSTIFGSDVPLDAYRALRRDVVARKLRHPHLRLVPAGDLGGELGVYNNDTREISISKDLARQAEDSQESAADLFLVLLHEFGHHIDNLLRREYTKPPLDGDAPGEEGAGFAYAIAGLDQGQTDRTSFAVHQRDGQKVPLELVYTAFTAAVQAYVADPEQQSNAKQNNVEAFSAGRGRPVGNFFAHQSIEDALGEADGAFFTAGVREQIYFGNWERDYSQFCTSAVLRIFQIALASQGLDASLARATITAYLDRKAKEEFRTFKAQVTTSNLGVYRAEEHIDNPEGLTDDRKIDPQFRGPILSGEIDVDKKTGIKNYIANSGNAWDTSSEYVRGSLLDAVGRGPTQEGFRLLGQALHTVEDLYAHSNFIELMFIRLGHTTVFPWVGFKSSLVVRGQSRFPMVTGVFGFVDTMISILSSIGESLKPPVECQGSVFSKGAVEAITLMLNGLINADPSGLGIPPVEPIQVKQDQVAEELGKFTKFLCESAEGTKTWIKRKVGAVLHTLLGDLALFEADFIRDIPTKGRTDPTHSMLSKDHPDHPLHPIAARCAKAAVAQIGLAMRDAWSGKTTDLDLPGKVALGYFVHPNDVQLVSGDRQGDLALLIEAFAANPANAAVMKNLTVIGSVRTFIKLADAERKELAQLSDDLIDHDVESARRALALIPELDPHIGRRA